MVVHRCFPILAVVALWASGASGADFDLTDPPQGIFFDQYYSVYLGDVKCGYQHSQFSRNDDRIVGRNDLLLQLARDTLVLKVSQSSQTAETIDGKPIDFYTRTFDGFTETIYEGTFSGSDVRMAIAKAGRSVTHRFELPAETTLSWGEFLELRRAGLAPGSEYTSAVFDPTLGPQQVLEAHTKIIGPAEMTVAGKTIKGIQAISRTEKPLPLMTTSLLDKQGHPLLVETFIGTFKLAIVAASKDEAFDEIKTKEFFIQSFVKPTKPIHLEADRPLRLKLTLTGKDAQLPNLPETRMQRVISKEENSCTIEIIHSPKTGTLKTETAAVVDPKYLADSVQLNLTDPLLIRLANENCDPKDSDLAKAQKLSQFVTRYITNKSYAIAFAPAAQVAQLRQGDCTEHAVLLAALCRIVKVPSRTIIGLVHDQGGSQGSFVYHMWTQCFVEGEWIDLDPALNQLWPDQTHIALATLDLSDAGFVAEGMKLIQLIGQLSIEPIDD